MFRSSTSHRRSFFQNGKTFPYTERYKFKLLVSRNPLFYGTKISFVNKENVQSIISPVLEKLEVELNTDSRSRVKAFEVVLVKFLLYLSKFPSDFLVLTLRVVTITCGGRNQDRKLHSSAQHQKMSAEEKSSLD
ncbi:hypothetical protein TNIN_253351 [Trichonephila inaurata madagascariensis]|uniref:Uncharacterized protein n=1 Tax=Trichonephila inaurata madagascariensis TaxID=2747483 RepID=A0A8X6YHV5_9ARAC|nr:hypothetical protein TNIN_253351 [Trichonephila inaurata madagascariensis]